MLSYLKYTLLFAILLAAYIPASHAQPARSERMLEFIETHIHLKADYKEKGQLVQDFDAAARAAIKSMDEMKISKGFLMPPPFAPDNPTIYDYKELKKIADKYPEHFAFIGGGGTLNTLIQMSLKMEVTDTIKETFEEYAHRIARDGAVGYGEMTALHLSFRDGHSYEGVSPDHELFLLLSDIAAENGLPIDIHMEPVTKDIPLPSNFKSPPNPETLTENITAFERLLKHNRKAKIVWAHVGWDNTGHGTVDLYERLLKAHPNLYLQLKVYRDSNPSTMILDRGKMKPEWKKMIESYSDRFILGSDNFYGIPGKTRKFPNSTKGSRQILRSLSPNIAKKIGIENVKQIYRLQNPL